MRRPVGIVRAAVVFASVLAVLGCVTVAPPASAPPSATAAPPATATLIPPPATSAPTATAAQPTATAAVTEPPTLAPTDEPTAPTSTALPSTPPTQPPSAPPSTPTGSLPPVGATIFSDDFEGETRYLSRGTQEGFGGSVYEDGVYRVTAEPREGYVNYQGGGSRSGCSGTECEFADEIHGDILTASVEVDVTQLAGAPDGGFGIGCAYEGTGVLGRFVGLTISSDGRRYAIAVNSAPGDAPLDQLIGGADRGEPHPSLTGGLGVTHHLRADCGDQFFNFWVDGTLVASGALPEPFDPPAFERGIGLVVAAGMEEAVEVEFDNLVVSQLPAEPVPVDESGLVIYADPLASQGPAWPAGEFSVGAVEFRNGAYVITPAVNQRAAVFPVTMVPPTDVAIQAEITFVSGHELMSAGVHCRASSTGWYAGEIRFDGSFSVAREGLLGTERLVDWTASSAIEPEGSGNVVRLVCDGDTITLLVNETEVASVTDAIVVDPGGGGVQATSPEEAPADSEVVVEFRDYLVTHP